MINHRLLALLAWGSFALVGATFGATSEETINELIPKLAVPKVSDRYAAQMELQALASAASQPGNGSARAELGRLFAAKVADPAVPQPARVWITRQLEYMGGAEAVPALDQLLGEKDAELRECARRALEKNPAPEATASLRAALQKGGDDAWRIGLINALGQQKDSASAALIIPQLDQPQTIVAAALALGKIATPPAVEALWKKVDKNDAVAVALIGAANQLAADNKRPSATAIYKKIYQQANLAVSARAAALTGLAKTDAAAAAPFVSKALTGTEAPLQNVAVVVAPIALGRRCSSTLAGLMPRLSTRAKTLVLGILDASAEKVAGEATQDADGGVRLAAIEALGRMGGGPSVPTLMACAIKDVKAEKVAAEGALSRINGKGADAAIEKAARQGDSQIRVTAINSLASRSQKAAIPALLTCAEDTDARVRKAAFTALGRLAGDGDLDALVKLASGANAGEAFTAIEAAAQRLKDKPVAAKKLLVLATDEARQTALIGALSVLGGREALDVGVKLAASANANTRETAIQALGNWPDISAAKPLLALASDATLADNLHSQTLQSIVRLVNAIENEPTDSLAEIAMAAMSSARNASEKKLVLSLFGTVPHPKMVATVKAMLGDPEFKAEAGQAAISLAEILVKTNQAAGKEVAQAVKDAAISTMITRRANRVLNR